MFKLKIVTYARVALSALFLVGCFLVLPNQVRAADWTIDNFDSVIEVSSAGDIRVTETIEVNFNVQKHGIFRSLPVIYRDRYNNRLKTEVAVEEVLQDGQPAMVKSSRTGGDIMIRIGDPNETITGAHIYKVTYTVDRAVLFFDDYDELYWNVTGTDWEVPIAQVRAQVILPTGTEILSTACYTGYYGSTEQACESNKIENQAAFTASDFLTVAVSFPKGAVAEPAVGQKIAWFALDNWVGIFPLGLILAVFFLWWKLGRDPKIDTIIAEYEPPIGLKAVYAGMLVKPRITRQSIAAMILQLATDGYIKIKVTEKEKRNGKKKIDQITIIKTKKSESKLDPAHREVYKMLLGNSDKRTLSQIKKSANSGRGQKIRKELYRQLQRDGYYAKSGFTWRTALYVLAVLQLYFAIFLVFVATYFGFLAGSLMLVSGLMTIVFAFLMPRRTPQGAKVAEKVLGFKLFMHTAERYRAAWQEKEHIFFDFLPYAIAFNDVRHWAEIFKDIDLEKQVPSWYVGQYSLISTADFSTSLTGAIASLATAGTPAPSSSGSSGSGFSGGGFGGGGGGSW